MTNPARAFVGKAPKSSIWLGTLNNPDVALARDYVEKWHTVAKARYCNGQLEKGKEGTVHVQFFLNFENPVRMTQLKKHCPRAHFEPVKVDNGASSYCLKEDTRLEGPWEFGTKPVRRNNKVDWEEQRKFAQMGQLDKIDPKIYISSYFQLKAIAKDHQVIPKRSEAKKCLWLWGAPGSGKTRCATRLFPEAYKKLQNKWYDGYDGQEAVILDDLGKEVAKFLTTHIKLWADPWQNQPAETKGGQITLAYNYFVVTSNYHPFDLWEGVDLEAIERRFTIIKFEHETQ